MPVQRSLCAAGMAGRGWRSLLGMVSLFVDVMSHLVANAGAR
jgi:hypothetical protein